MVSKQANKMLDNLYIRKCNYIHNVYLLLIFPVTGNSTPATKKKKVSRGVGKAGANAGGAKAGAKSTKRGAKECTKGGAKGGTKGLAKDKGVKDNKKSGKY